MTEAIDRRPIFAVTIIAEETLTRLVERTIYVQADDADDAYEAPFMDPTERAIRRYVAHEMASAPIEDSETTIDVRGDAETVVTLIPNGGMFFRTEPAESAPEGDA